MAGGVSAPKSDSGTSGSGVIVSEDGLVLTAGHVSGEPGKKIRILLHDGTKVDGITLGYGPKIDSGLAKITTEGKWPYTEMGVAKASPETVRHVSPKSEVAT